MTPRLVRSRPSRPSRPLRLTGAPGSRGPGLLLAVLALVSCEDSTAPTPVPPVAPVPTALELSTDQLLFSFLGGSEAVLAQVLDQDGDPMADEPVVFSVVDEAVAPVDTTGLVTAEAEGVTELVATSGTLTARAAVEVRTGWMAVATGNQHACGLWGHGVAFCWGDNGFGQLGLGPEGGEGSTVPAPVELGVDSEGVRFEALALGDSHSCGLAHDGRVFCWGWNAVGQLGTGDTHDRNAPAPVEADEQFAQLTTGASHNCAVTTAGTGLCWGGGGGFQDGRDLAMGFEPPDPCSSPGPFFSSRCSLTPRQIQGDLTFATISAGLFHSCGIGADGRSWCWGWNRGQLGNGENHPDDPDGTAPGYDFPTLVSGALTFDRISAGNVHSCAITPGGDAWCWGEEDFQSGALGNGDIVGTSVPTEVDSDASFSTVSAAAVNGIYNQFTCGLDDGGSAWCWGANRRGQLGAMSRDSCAVAVGQIPCSVSPVPVDTDLTFQEIATGLEFSCARDTDEGVWCWGANDVGQLGNGGGVDRPTPVRVSDPPPVEGPDAMPALGG